MRVHDLVRCASSQNARIGIRAHAAGVRTQVAVEDPLVILRWFEGNAAFAIAEHDEAHLFAFEEFFDHHRKGQRGDSILGFLLRFAR